MDSEIDRSENSLERGPHTIDWRRLNSNRVKSKRMESLLDEKESEVQSSWFVEFLRFELNGLLISKLDEDLIEATCGRKVGTNKNKALVLQTDRAPPEESAHPLTRFDFQVFLHDSSTSLIDRSFLFLSPFPLPRRNSRSISSASSPS